jgi:hypothetical protein
MMLEICIAMHKRGFFWRAFRATLYSRDMVQRVRHIEREPLESTLAFRSWTTVHGTSFFATAVRRLFGLRVPRTLPPFVNIL